MFIFRIEGYNTKWMTGGLLTQNKFFSNFEILKNTVITQETYITMKTEEMDINIKENTKVNMIGKDSRNRNFQRL